MSAQANLVLNTKTYSPRGNLNGVAKRVLAGDTTFGGAPSAATSSVRDPSTNGTVYRVKFKLDVPKAATVDSSCSCTGQYVGEAICNIDVSIPMNFTLAERQDLRLRIQALTSDAIFVSAVDELVGSW